MNIVVTSNVYSYSIRDLFAANAGSIFEGSDNKYYYVVTGSEKTIVCLNENTAYVYDNDSYLNTIGFRLTGFITMKLF